MWLDKVPNLVDDSLRSSQSVILSLLCIAENIQGRVLAGVSTFLQYLQKEWLTMTSFVEAIWM